MAATTDGRTLRAERRRAETRQRLIDAVGTLLSGGRPYAEVSVEELAAEAGLSRSMFYTYYDDKGAVMAAWLRAISDRVGVAAEAWWNLGERSTKADLRATIAEMVDTFRPYAPLLAAAHDAAASDETAREALDGMLAYSIRGLSKHVARGKREGWIDPAAPTAETAAWLTCLAESGQHRLEQEVADAELALLIDAAVDVIWRVLYAGAPARG